LGKLKETHLERTVISVLNYFPQILDVKNSVVCGERIKEKPWKGASSLGMEITYDCERYYYVSQNVNFSIELVARTLKKKKKIKQITVVLQQTLVLEKKYDVPFNYTKSINLKSMNINIGARFPPKNLSSSDQLWRKIPVNLLLDLDNRFVPSYMRNDCGIEVEHTVLVRASIKGGTDLIACLPLTILHSVLPDVEEKLQMERPKEISKEIPLKKNVEGFYEKDYIADNNVVFI